MDNTEGYYHLTIYDNYPYKENLGKLWNRLIKQSTADYICLLNSDTVVTPNWIDKLLETFQRVEKVGCVGPSTDNSVNKQSKDKPEEVFVDYSLYHPGWDLSGFCLVFPKQVWEEARGFREDFGFYGQEVAFIDRIVAAGYKQIWRTDVFVHHEKGASIKKAQAAGEINEEAERAKARELFGKLRKELNGHTN
jgi:GT2 family glycosyltransferase